jgi:RNA polymerase sigma factor (sigma-70 family)
VSTTDYSSPPSVEILYLDHHNWLQSWLRRRLGCAADAADLAHDAFLRLINTPKQFNSLPEARGYLRSMAQGLCIDLWRHREVEHAWLETLACHPEMVEPSPEQRALVVETLLEIGKQLGCLSQKAAAAFIMAQVDGMPYREIAAQLGVSERMVKKYIAQAMLQCAQIEAKRCA